MTKLESAGEIGEGSRNSTSSVALKSSYSILPQEFKALETQKINLIPVTQHPNPVRQPCNSD